MFARLLLLFTVVPALELYLLIQLGQWIGAVQTVAIIVVTGSLGALLAKREGLGVIRQLQADTASGLPPGDRLMEGLMVLIGGALLITPGVVTDATGFFLIMPWSRRWLAPRLVSWAAARLLSGEGGMTSGVEASFMGAEFRVGSPRTVRTRRPLKPADDATAPSPFSHPEPKPKPQSKD